MFTTYAMTLPTKKWTEETRERAIAVISQWHQQWFPADRLPINIRVRIRHSQDDEVFRLEVQTLIRKPVVQTSLLRHSPHTRVNLFLIFV